MESEQGKLFIGGISWETTEEKLKDYFNAFGEVVEAVIMKDRATGRARGFGFIVFADPSVADRVVLEKHSIDGRLVEAKKAVPRDDQQTVNRNSNVGVAGPGPSNLARTKKIFVGGLASTVTEEDFKRYFGQFGTITDVVVMYDHGTQRPRGFGFITYESEDSVDKVLHKIFHELNDKMVEVKRAVPKDLTAGASKNNGLGIVAGPGSRGSPYAGPYAQAFTSSPITSYAAQMDSRYASSPSSRGLYAPYGASWQGNTKIQTGSIPGSYNSGSYGGSESLNGIGYGPGIYGNSFSGGGYGSLGNSNSFGHAYGSSPSRNPWGNGGASYDNVGGSGFEVGSRVPSLSGYGGTKTWGSAPTHSNNNDVHDNRRYSYEGAANAILDSRSFGYDGKSSGLESFLGGLGTSRSRSGGGTLSGDIYGSLGLSDSTWRVTPADKFRSASAGFGQLGSGVYGLNRSTNNIGEDLRAVDDGYGAPGGQSYKGVPV